MLKRLLSVAVFFTAVYACNAQTRSENLFYMVNTPESFESFRANVSQISIVCPQTFLVSKEGTLSGSVDSRVLALAKANNVKVMPLIVNSGFDQKLLHDIVTNPVARKRSIEMMLEYAKKFDLDGWQFDLLGQNNAKKVWHEKAQVHWAMWDNEGVFEYLFIEDAQSLKPKLDLLKKYNLRGISVWVLGGEDPEGWKVLKKETVRIEL